MWVSSRAATEFLGVEYELLRKAAWRAEKQSKKFCSIRGHICHFTYTDGVGRGGKTLQIWIDDNLINGENSEIPQQSAPAPIKNSAESEDKCLEPTPSAPQNECSDARRSRSGVSCERSEAEQNEPSDARRSRSGVSCERSEAEQNALSLKIKDIEKMNKLKAVNELKSCPAGMSKTLWGKGVAAKYEVSLKTLYSWAKLFKQSEVEVRNDELSIDFKAKFKSSSFEMSALEWAVGFMLHNPLASKSFAYEQLQSYAKDNALKIGSYQSFARLTAAPEIKAMLLRASCGDRGVRNEWAMHIIRDLNCYESMEMICGDQIVFDFDAVGPGGEVVNPNAYVWIDMGSGAIIGIDIVLGKYNRLSVGNSLKMALRFGIPDAIYTDNGKPELSEYITGVRSQLSGIKFRDFDDLAPNLLHKKAKVRNSRAKPIENIFNHVQRKMGELVICERGGSGYHKDGDRQSEIVAKYMKQNPLNFTDFIAYFERAVRWWNEHYNASRKIYPLKSFLDKLEAKPRAVFDETTLEYIFSERRSIRVRNSCVSLSIMGRRRTYSHPALCKFVGQNVEVRINRGEVESVFVVDMQNNRPVCEAHLIDRIDPRDHTALSAQLAKNEAVVSAVRQAFSYYANLYKRPNTISSYASTAFEVDKQRQNSRRLHSKIAMSNEELLAAM
nr:MAG TPA: transposase [Caudoviricetes sp.]